MGAHVGCCFTCVTAVSRAAQAITVAAVLANNEPSTYLKASWQPSGLEEGMAEFLCDAAAEAIAQWRRATPHGC